MRVIEMRDLGQWDEKGSVFSRTIAGLSSEEKPEGFYEGIALRDGDVYLEIDGGVYMYDETNDQWHEKGGV